MRCIFFFSAFKVCLIYNSPMALSKKWNLECQKKHFKTIHVSYDRDVSALNTLLKCVTASRVSGLLQRQGVISISLNSCISFIFSVSSTLLIMCVCVCACACVYMHVSVLTARSQKVGCLKTRSLIKKKVVHPRYRA